MGQQPNIELEIADLPRPTSHPAPARRWSPDRPGELHGPDAVPWGGAYGTPGPDTGWAITLVRRAGLVLTGPEDHHDVEAGLAAIAGARASRFGRAPVPQDVKVAAVLLGYDAAGVPSAVSGELARDRVAWLSKIGHDAGKARALVGAVAVDVLTSTPDELRARMAAGERLVTL